MTDLLNKDTITLDDLREQLRKNDFTTFPIKDTEEYSTEEQEAHSYIANLMDEKWQENARKMGQKHPSSCYSKDFPTELLRDRLENLVSDNVMAILNDENAFNNIMESIVNPALEAGANGDEYLNNTVSALMKTVDFESLLSLSQKLSDDDDFNGIKAQNFPKIDHERKWNHSRSKMKSIPVEDITEEICDEKVQVEEQAVASADYKMFLDSCSDMDRQICIMLTENYTQSEIAKALGTTQSNVSKHISALRKRLCKAEN